MAVYPGPVTVSGDFKSEVTCYTGAEARNILNFYLILFILIGLLAGYVLVLFADWFVPYLYDNFRDLFDLPFDDWPLYFRVLRRMAFWVARHTVLPYIFALLIGLVVAILFWLFFLRRKTCPCPAGRFGICIQTWYTRKLIVFWVPYLVTASPVHCGIIPPGCP